MINSAELTHDGYVYVLSAGPYVKVGRSKNPDDRIKKLKIQLPFPVIVETVFPCENAVVAERSLHQLMSRSRVNGEWFDLSDDPYMLLMLKDIGYMTHETEDPNGDYCLQFDWEEIA